MKALDFVLVLALGLLLGSVATCLVNRQADPDPAYWVAMAKYDELAGQADAQHQVDLQAIADAQGAIEAQGAIIADILAQASHPTEAEQAKDVTIAALQKKVATLESQGDLAAALAASKAEVKAWAEKFTLAERRHQDSTNALNSAWQVKFDAQAQISDTWQAAYDREHSLRLTAESILDKQTKKTKTDKWLRRGGYVLAFLAGNLSHR